MPKISNEPKETNTKTKSVEKEVVSTNNETYSKKEIDAILQDNIELKSMLSKLMQKLENNEQKTEENNDISHNEDIENVGFIEPSPNKQIRVISLCRGVLNLYSEIGCKGKLYSFSKFGEIKSMLYSTLIDIVNANHSFAEEGKFYILDEASVYFLGLSDVYKNILTSTVIENILDYNARDIKTLCENISDSQKEELAYRTALKIFQGQDVDLNKVKILAETINIDIMEKVNEMKSVQEFSK